MDNRQIEDSIIESQEIAQIGEWLEKLISHKYWGVFEKHILDEIYQDAFRTFQKVDPADTGAVSQAQKMGQIVLEIKKRLNIKIQNSRLIREQLKHLNSTQMGEGGSDGEEI